MSLLFRYIIPYNTYHSPNKLISLNKKPSSVMAVWLSTISTRSLTSQLFTKVSRPSIVSMPLSLKYSCSNMTKLSRFSIFNRRLLCSTHNAVQYTQGVDCEQLFNYSILSSACARGTFIQVQFLPKVLKLLTINECSMFRQHSDPSFCQLLVNTAIYTDWILQWNIFTAVAR